MRNLSLFSVATLLISTLAVHAQKVTLNEWQQTMGSFRSQVTAVLTRECPKGSNLAEFTMQVSTGRRKLSVSGEAQIKAATEPVLQIANRMAAQNGIAADNNDELLFTTSFSPEWPVDTDLSTVTAVGLTGQEIFGCALGALGVDFLYAAGWEAHGTKWAIKSISKAFGRIASRFLGPVGVAIAVATFSYCLYQEAND